MGDLHRNAERKPRVEKFPRRVEDLLCVVPDVGGDELALFSAARGGLDELFGVHARLVADTVGDPEAAPVERGLQLPRHLRALGGGGGGVAVGAARQVPEEAVSREHRHIHRRAVAVHQIEVVGGVVLVLAAVAGHRGGDAHAQHAGENGLVVVGFQPARRVDRVLVHVDVDEARADDLAGGVDHRIGVRRRGRDTASVDPDIPLFVDTGGGINDSAVLN